MRLPQTAAEQLQELVVNRLRDDPSMRSILDNTSGDLKTDPQMIRRVELALEKRVFEDIDYAVELQLAVERLEAGRSAWVGRIALDSGARVHDTTSPGDDITDPAPAHPLRG